MTMEELTLDIIEEAIKTLDDTPVYGDTFYIDGIFYSEMPEEVKARIEWAFDHIYISDNLEEVKDAHL